MPGVKDWLKKAASDLKASKKLSDDQETLDCSLFHTHQCVEKALKAFIVFGQHVVPRTHDLKVLLLSCAEINEELILLREDVKDLNPYGVESRYPSDSFYVDTHITQAAIITAEKILNVVKKKIQG